MGLRNSLVCFYKESRPIEKRRFLKFHFKTTSWWFYIEILLLCYTLSMKLYIFKVKITKKYVLMVVKCNLKLEPWTRNRGAPLWVHMCLVLDPPKKLTFSAISWNLL